MTEQLRILNINTFHGCKPYVIKRLYLFRI